MILLLLLSVTAFAAEKTGLAIVSTQTAQLGKECLPKKSKKDITSEHRTLRVEKAFDRTKSGDTLYTEIHKMEVGKGDVENDDPCGLLQRKRYFEGKLFEVKKLQPRFTYVEFEKVGYECGSAYEPAIPRLDMWFESSSQWGGFLLDGDFSVLAGARRKQAEKDFAVIKKRDNLYDKTLVDFFTREKNPKVIYVVLNQSELGTEYAIYRMEKKKLVEVDSAYEPPCGS